MKLLKKTMTPLSTMALCSASAYLNRKKAFLAMKYTLLKMKMIKKQYLMTIYAHNTLRKSYMQSCGPYLSRELSLL